LRKDIDMRAKRVGGTLLAWGDEYVTGLSNTVGGAGYKSGRG